MDYYSIKDLLLKIDSSGTSSTICQTNLFNSPNRQHASKELNNVHLHLLCDERYFLNEDESEYLTFELSWFTTDYTKLSRSHQDYVRNMIHDLCKELLNCSNRAGRNSNYGHICLYKKNANNMTQIDWVINKLKTDRNTRQAVAFYNSPEYQYNENEDFVCTLNQYFYISNDCLKTVVNLRSSDIINGLRYDIVWYETFFKLVYNKLKSFEEFKTLRIDDRISLNIMSAHFYEKDRAKFNKIIKGEFIK